MPRMSMKQSRNYAIVWAILLLLLASIAFADQPPHQYAGEITEWVDHRDGSSTIEVECMPGRRLLRVRVLDNKALRKIRLNKLIQLLDERCSRGY